MNKPTSKKLPAKKAAKKATATAAPKKPDAVETVKVEKAEKVEATEKVGLNWAYRRLRRQALLFYSKDMSPEEKSELRKKLEAIKESFTALRDAFGSDELLMKLTHKRGHFDGKFLEWFFGHEIHPRSQAE